MAQFTGTTQQIIRLKDVILITGLSRSTIYEKQNPKSPRFDSSFPPKVKLGARAVGWFKEEVEEWLTEKATQVVKGN